MSLLAASPTSWENAAQMAITEAKKTVHGIHGIKVQDITADVDGSGKIVRYKTTIKMSFGVEH